MSEKSLGERRVRTEFNPSKDGTVDQIKQKSAELINFIKALKPPESMPPSEHGEFFRAQAEAMTGYEAAAHWAVKTATF